MRAFLLAFIPLILAADLTDTKVKYADIKSRIAAKSARGEDYPFPPMLIAQNLFGFLNQMRRQRRDQVEKTPCIPMAIDSLTFQLITNTTILSQLTIDFSHDGSTCTLAENQMRFRKLARTLDSFHCSSELYSLLKNVEDLSTTHSRVGGLIVKDVASKFLAQEYLNLLLESGVVNEVSSAIGILVVPKAGLAKRWEFLTIKDDLAYASLLNQHFGSLLEKGNTQIIGSGGFGTVHKAILNGITVAVKELDLTKEHASRIVELEINALNMVATESQFVTIYESKFDGLYKFQIFMELLDGFTLIQLKRNGVFPITIPLPHLANIFKQVLTGLHFLHGKNYAYADLKPDNVILTKDGRVKIVDLGAVTQIRGNAIVTAMTDVYAPVEIIASKEFDTWTFAMTMLDFLGIRQGDKKNQHEVLFNAILDGLVEVKNALYSAPNNDAAWNSFSDLIITCLQAQATDRPTSTDLLQHAFFTQYAASEGETTAWIKNALSRI